jgi:hypothetical protein
LGNLGNFASLGGGNMNLGKKKTLIYLTSLMMRGTCTISMHNLWQHLSLVNYWFCRQLTLNDIWPCGVDNVCHLPIVGSIPNLLWINIWPCGVDNVCHLSIVGSIPDFEIIYDLVGSAKLVACQLLVPSSTYFETSVNPVPNAQMCYFNNVWFMF